MMKWLKGLLTVLIAVVLLGTGTPPVLAQEVDGLRMGTYLSLEDRNLPSTMTLYADHNFEMEVNVGEGLAVGSGTWFTYDVDGDTLLVLELGAKPLGFQDLWEDSYVLHRSNDGSSLYDLNAYLGLLNESTVFVHQEETIVPSTAISVLVNGEKIHFPDQQPLIENGRTYLPVRFVAEALDALVEWDGDNQEVRIKKDGMVLSLWLDSILLQKTSSNGEYEVIDMDVIPILVSGRTLLPIRFVAEALGCTVGWDESTQTVTIASAPVMGAAPADLRADDYSSYLGWYSNNWSADRDENPENSASYSVHIKSIANGNITFSITYVGTYWSPIYETYEDITAPLQGSICERFGWADTWENEGNGSLRLEDGNVVINVVEGYSSPINRATLDTGGDLVLWPDPNK